MSLTRQLMNNVFDINHNISSKDIYNILEWLDDNHLLNSCGNDFKERFLFQEVK